MGIHIAPSPADSPSGAFQESWADLLFAKGFDGSQPIVYLSTDAGQPLTAVLERSTYVPALNDASCNGCDDFLGSARERLFGFVNGQTGVNNPNAQGFQHFAKDGPHIENAVQTNTAFINAMRYGGDILNVFGDFPTLTDPRHADAYSPLWDAQLAMWTPKAVSEGLNKRQINENEVLNLAYSQSRPADRGQPGHRPAPAVRLGRGRHQLRGHRLHGDSTPNPWPPQPPGLPVPAQVTGPPPQAPLRPCGRCLAARHLKAPRARDRGPAGTRWRKARSGHLHGRGSPLPPGIRRRACGRSPVDGSSGCWA